jgi:hypothetical protein
MIGELLAMCEVSPPKSSSPKQRPADWKLLIGLASPELKKKKKTGECHVKCFNFFV